MKKLAFLKHPFSHLVIFLAFSYSIKEFYPFTHIPMYSDPEPRAPYYHLADGEDQPIGVKTHSGVTNPKMRKMYRSRLEKFCKEHNLDNNEPTPEAEAAIGEEVIGFLRKRSNLRNRPLAETVRLYHVQVEPAPAPNGFRETRTLVFESKQSS